MSGKHTIPAVDKSLKLLQVLAEASEPMTSAQLARKLEITPSTCYRILQTLVGRDWLRGTSNGAFTFSAGMFPLLKPLSDYQKLFESLGAPLRSMVDQTGLTAKISVKQGDVASTVYRVESPRPLSPSFKVGGSFSLAYGSSGACLMAELADEEVDRILSECSSEIWAYQKPEDVWARIRSVRDTGVCLDCGMYQPSVYGLSVSVHNRDQRGFAALSLIGWANDFTEDKLESLKQSLIECAERCTATLGEKAVA
ncbi:IclR family transcriptional regulator [Coraliomargarita parva]|uniref:IclR family transcriptional regulator n=1 Tax=Coraliomargarita parva TaxID=3014050 RepID=UPI0022B5BB04|nr:IclR family transcriptional regulator [Coraliomargarita parva]